ncbi:MAG: hypothetical protein R3B70_30925 [Polyangiaceae bacterium]
MGSQNTARRRWLVTIRCKCHKLLARGGVPGIELHCPRCGKVVLSWPQIRALDKAIHGPSSGDAGGTPQEITLTPQPKAPASKAPQSKTPLQKRRKTPSAPPDDDPAPDSEEDPDKGSDKP